MTRTPSVAVGIVTYGPKRLGYLRPVLDSVMSQTVKPCQVIVVDNGSNPEIQKFLLEYPNTKYIDPGENTGPAGGYYRIICQARQISEADFLLLLDDDSLLSSKDAIETYIREFQRIVSSVEPKLGALSCRRGESTIIKNLKILKMCGNSGLFLKREVFEKVNYRHDLFFGQEDFYFCASILKAGYRIYGIPHRLIEFLEPQLKWERKKFANIELPLPKAPAWRWYYATRNRILLYRYIFGNKRVALEFCKSIARMILYPILWRDWRYSKFILWGLVDFLRGRMGRVVEPEGYDEGN